MPNHTQIELDAIATKIANASIRLVEIKEEQESLEAHLRELKTAHNTLAKVQQAMQKEDKPDVTN